MNVKQAQDVLCFIFNSDYSQLGINLGVACRTEELTDFRSLISSTAVSV